MQRFLAIFAASILVTSSVLAQQPAPMPSPTPGTEMKGMGMDMKMMMPGANDSPSTKAFKSKMMNAMQSMPNFSGDADSDFMKHMRHHHQAAIEMAKVVVANGKDADVKKLAQQIIAAQEKEIATIDAWLKKKG